MHEEKQQKFMFFWQESKWIFDQDAGEWIIDNDHPDAVNAEDFVYWFFFNRLDRNHDLAQELQGEVALRAFHKYYQCRDNFRAWVKTIALNVLREYFRKKGSGPLTISIDKDDSDESTPGPELADPRLVEDEVISKVLIEQTFDLLKKQDPFAYECIRLSYTECMTQVEIYEHLGRDRSAVNRAMKRAQDFIANVLKQHGEDFL